MLLLCIWKISAGKIYRKTVCINTNTEQIGTAFQVFINTYFADNASKLRYRYECS